MLRQLGLVGDVKFMKFAATGTPEHGEVAAMLVADIVATVPI